MGQLRISVSAIYGSGIDAGKYLQKFISFTMHLTEGETRPDQRTSAIYIDHLMTEMVPETEFSETIESAKQYYRHLAYRTELSFREIEKIISYLAISLAYRPPNVFCSTPILIGLCALKVVSPDIYARAKSGKMVFHDARVPLGFGVEPEQREKHVVDRTEKAWRYFSDPSIAPGEPDFQGFLNQHERANLERSAAVGFVARNIVDRLS
jgi:hypothetical protein